MFVTKKSSILKNIELLIYNDKKLIVITIEDKSCQPFNFLTHIVYCLMILVLKEPVLPDNLTTYNPLIKDDTSKVA